MELGRIRGALDAWEESKHPRANNGQFTSGSGGGGSSKTPAQKEPKASSGNPISEAKKIGQMTGTEERKKAVAEFATKNKISREDASLLIKQAELGQKTGMLNTLLKHFQKNAASSSGGGGKSATFKETTKRRSQTKAKENEAAASKAKETLSDIDKKIAQAKKDGDQKRVSFLEATKKRAEKKAGGNENIKKSHLGNFSNAYAMAMKNDGEQWDKYSKIANEAYEKAKKAGATKEELAAASNQAIKMAEAMKPMKWQKKASSKPAAGRKALRKTLEKRPYEKLPNLIKRQADMIVEGIERDPVEYHKGKRTETVAKKYKEGKLSKEELQDEVTKLMLS
jgi:hypothetical protein